MNGEQTKCNSIWYVVALLLIVNVAGCALARESMFKRKAREMVSMSQEQLNTFSALDLCAALKITGSENIKENLLSRPSFKEDDIYYIRNNSVRIGMSEYAMLCAIGRRPNDINKSVGKWGTHKQYVFRYDRYNVMYVYLENGIVTSVQD